MKWNCSACYETASLQRDWIFQIAIWIFSYPFEGNLNLYDQQIAFTHVNLCDLDTYMHCINPFKFRLLSEIERHCNGVFGAQYKCNS